MRLSCRELREIGIVQTPVGANHPLPVEAGEALLHISRILRAALLAVVHHVQSDGLLPGHHFRDPVAHPGGKQVRVELPLVFPFPQKFLEMRCPRQAAGMSRENPRHCFSS